MELYLGSIFQFAGAYAPLYTAQCLGQPIPVNQNQALFTIVGNLYGGTAPTTFNLPDLRGRVMVGSGTSPYLNNATLNPGTTGGTANTTLTQANLPLHTHAASVAGGGGSSTINATVNIPVSTAPGGQIAPSTSSDNWLAGVNFNENGSGAAFNGLYTNTDPGPGASLVGTATGNVTVTGGATVAVSPGGGVTSPASFTNVQPYLALTFLIVTQGYYPSRD